MTRFMLIVEDNATDEKLALRAFARSGMRDTIVVVRDGVEALDFLFAHGAHAQRDAAELPAVMLLDLKLPLIDGLEVLRRVRHDERTRYLPVVILTASKEEQDLQRSYELGVSAYVRKPIDFMEFANVADAIARFWMGCNEPAPPQRKTS